MIDQLESMEENFNKCKDHTSLKIILHKMEVQRLAYMINEYIRTRLKKVSVSRNSNLKQLLKTATEHVMMK